MTQQDEQPPVLALVRLGGALRRAFAARMAEQPWAARSGMRAGCFSVLRSVGSSPEPPSQRQLCDELGIDPSDMVGLIDVLESAGYVARERDPSDRRRHALTITPDGTEALAHFDVAASKAADDLFGVLPTAERAHLERLLAKVVAAHER